MKIKDNTIKTLEEKLGNSSKMITKLNETIFDYEETITQMKAQTAFHKRRIIELQNLDEEKELKISLLTKSIEELKDELKSTKEENHKIKYYLETSISKLKQASDREKNLESRNREIESRNLYLGVRAAEGFDNLTLRPSFVGIKDLMSEVPKSTREKTKKILSLLLIKNKTEAEVHNKKYTVIAKRSSAKSPQKSPVISPSGSQIFSLEE